MKGLTLQQPWATLVAIGAKKIETRCWYTSYRGPLLITASRRWGKQNQQIALRSPFIETLNRANYLPDIPLGAAVATCELVDCLPMEAHLCLGGVFDEYPELDTHMERKFGDFNVFDLNNGRRRWAFVLDNVQQLSREFPVKGSLGLWTVPEHLVVPA